MRFTFINRLALIPLLCVVAALEAQTTIHHTLVAQPGTWSVAPGVTATGWFYNGQLPGPLLRGTVGDTLRVQFINRTPEPTSVHFHGLPVPLGQDGVPMISRPAVEPGQEYTYTLPLTRPGTYFYHSHFGHQLDRGLHGLLIVDPATSSDAAYDRELIVDLDDLLPGDPIHGQDPIYADYLMNGKNSAGQTPWVVDQGDVLRIRFINSSSFTTYVVTLDGHLLEVSHADGRKVQPV
ncbi:MAG: multicopper oxidase domain-containing protein, partial [Planctomycetes bacterium]|nr:multicopper oxidase domain-containing protein [Planctomycetota bacterium]